MLPVLSTRGPSPEATNGSARGLNEVPSSLHHTSTRTKSRSGNTIEVSIASTVQRSMIFAAVAVAVVVVVDDDDVGTPSLVVLLFQHR